MKEYLKFISFVLIVFLGIITVTLSCSPSNVVCSEIPKDTVSIETVRLDTVRVVDHVKTDSLIKALSQARDSIKLYRDSIPYQDYINARRIEKINYYISLCEKNSTNKKFFYGWIKRTMTE